MCNLPFFISLVVSLPCWSSKDWLQPVLRIFVHLFRLGTRGYIFLRPCVSQSSHLFLPTQERLDLMQNSRVTIFSGISNLRKVLKPMWVSFCNENRIICLFVFRSSLETYYWSFFSFSFHVYPFLIFLAFSSLASSVVFKLYFLSKWNS